MRAQARSALLVHQHVQELLELPLALRRNHSAFNISDLLRGGEGVRLSYVRRHLNLPLYRWEMIGFRVS